MDRITEYLQTVSLPMAAAAALLALAVAHLVPLRLRFQTALAAMVVVLTVSQLPDLGVAAAAAKVTSGFMFLLVGITAYQAPGKRMSIPRCCYAYLIAGALAIFFVSGAADRELAIVLRVQWLLLAVSALLTTRTVVDEKSLHRVLRSLLVGAGISCLVTLSALGMAPIQAIYNGFGRFMPYQCNPNQIGILFAITTALAAYYSLRTRAATPKALALLCTAIALGQAVLTLSRGSFLVILLATTPSITFALRRPLFMIASVAVFGGILLALLRFAESSDFDRLTTSVEGRQFHAMDALEEIRDRSLFGLGFTEGLQAYDTDFNAHNAYLATLYMGGLSIGLPLIGLQLTSVWCVGRVWLSRRRLPIDPLLTTVLGGIALGLALHGFVNDMIYHPTYVWSYLNILVPTLFITLRRCVKRQAASVSAARMPSMQKGFAGRIQNRPMVRAA